MKQKVAIALSGGIDSLLAGHLLKQSGTDLFGIHFITGYEKERKNISFVSKQLDIPIQQVDLSDGFEKRVVSYFVSTYLAGKTPNPCVMCNKAIKFGALWEAARTFGADRIATGHYAITSPDRHGRTRLFKGVDSQKEQSYFLSMLSPDLLAKGVFPLGRYTKSEVKKTALTENLEPVEKKESQDICFIHHGDAGRFIAWKTGITETKGDIVKSDGTVMGEHDGVFKFTVGQRRKINCPGPEPYYVKTIDPRNNTLVIGTRDEILKKSFYIDSFNRISSDLEFPFRAVTKIRYNHPGARSIVVKEGERYKVEFEEPQHAVAPGQTAVFYKNNEVLGGGIIQ